MSTLRAVLGVLALVALARVGQVSGAPDQKTLEKMMTVLMEIGEDIKKDWAGRVAEWEEGGQAKKDFIIKLGNECYEESKGKKKEMRDCLIRTFVTWVKVVQNENGINCILGSRGDVDKLLACKSNGARVSAATDPEIVEKIGKLVQEIVEDIKKDWAGRVEELTGEDGQAQQNLIIKVVKECYEESKGKKKEMRDCLIRTFATWVKVVQTEDGIKCILDSAGDVDKLLACKSNGARVSGATDQETLEKIGKLVHEIVEDIKKDWAGRVQDWTGEDGQARMEMLVKELGECWEESKGDKDKMRDCMVRDFVTWEKDFQRADGINCMLDSRGDVDDLLACKANGASPVTTQVEETTKKPNGTSPVTTQVNGASSVTFDFFLGATLATVLLGCLD